MDFSLRKITDAEEKKAIVRNILEALPDWFGIPESRENYIAESVEEIMVAAEVDVSGAGSDDAAASNANGAYITSTGKKAAGFLCLKQTGKETIELAVMGVLMEYHRSGMGRALFEEARRIATEIGYEFMQVKTVEMGHYADYDATNRFYQSLGFKELEVFPLLWDEANPCQIYIMSLKKKTNRQ